MFDSPFFWIVVIWWLLSKFMGSSKRRKPRRVKYAPVEEPGESLFEEPEIDPLFVPHGQRTVKPASGGPAEKGEPVQPAAPRPATTQPQSLKELWRNLQREIEGATQQVAAAVPEFITQPREPAKPPPAPPAPPKVVEEEHHHEHHDTAKWGRRTAYRQPLERYRSRWSVAQQAIVYREILGPPVALRRARQR